MVACILTSITQFKEQYLLLCGDSDAQQLMQLTKLKKGLHALLCELSNNEDEITNMAHDIPKDSNQPWLQHFCAFMDAVEHVPDGWSAVKWWGVSVPNCKA
jgi:hypothetical protein